MIANLIAGILAMAFTHLGLIAEFKKKFKVANETFVLKRYFEDEWTQILRTLIVLCLTAMTVSIWTKAKQVLNEYQIVVFIAMGSFGTLILSYALGKTQKYIMGIIDKKTNIADGIDNKEKD